MEFLLTLDDISPRDRDRVGGKAMWLARLAAKGLPVPPALVVPVEVYRGFLQDQGLWDRARAGGDAALAADIRAGHLDPRFAGELRRRAAELGPLLAVRSSATDEDSGEASFAGQYETSLGVRPGDETERALLSCWASAWSERARLYRHGHAPRPDGMGVVVQRLVEPRCAGVLFTINPITGSWREMTVEAAWGLGEAVVGGRVVPDYYRVRRPRRSPAPVQRLLARVRLDVIEDHVRPQREQWVAGRGGLVSAPVPPARIEAPKLLHEDLLRLCRLGLRVEASLGGPQDVEWALDEDGRLFVLQARPVTTGQGVRRTGSVVWTRRFIGERWTEPATPLGWSLMRDLLSWFIAYPDTNTRYLGGEPPTRLYRSAPYFNVTVFRHLAFKLPGMPPPRFMVELLPPDEAERWLRREAMSPDLRVYASILAETKRERRWERFRWNLFTNWKAWSAYEARLDQAITRDPRLSGPPRDIADARLRAGLWRELCRDYIKVHICSLLFANIWYQLGEGVLLAEGRGAEAADVLRPPATNWTVRTNHDLWRLGHGQVNLDEFLKNYGHRASSSWELFSPRWAEQPEHVALLARTVSSHADPRALAEQQSARATQAIERLHGPGRLILELARKYLLLREDQRFHFDRLAWGWKQVYLWLERELGLPVRFLEHTELDQLIDGGLARQDAVALVDRRSGALEQERLRRAEGDEPPDFLVGDEIIDAPHAGPRLEGLGISPGVATGPVRILRTPADADRLREGDILVARATDPGWTPLFLVAGGLVLEQGGVLSHGAVVAREYRVPGVVNVPHATRRLKEGQVVSVDGTRGVVWVQ